MYESPIELKIENIVSDVVKQVDEYTLRCFQQIGVNIDKDELIKALEYDRGQYEKGWNDRDSEIVRCKDCIHCTYDNRQLLYLCDYTPFDDYIQVAPLDYCSWGERRKDGKTD